MVINLAKNMKFCASREDALAAHKIIKSALVKHDVVCVSFSGISGISSSFVNGALIPLLEIMPFIELQRRVKITNIAPQGAEIIKLCFANVTGQNKAA
tara:strand:+ start:800 stop:1093 length:294 start_codon:yes stop_codon:yes gene_type:complete